jgi:hypothetical protein
VGGRVGGWVCAGATSTPTADQQQQRWQQRAQLLQIPRQAISTGSLDFLLLFLLLAALLPLLTSCLPPFLLPVPLLQTGASCAAKSLRGGCAGMRAASGRRLRM